MKNYIIVIAILILFSSCGSNGTQNENYVAYVSYDTKVASNLKNNEVVDSLFSVKYDSIIPASITLNSIKYYIVEGDLLLNEYEYTQYKISRLVISYDKKLTIGKLIVEKRNNKPVRWPENYVIKYCIAENSFPTSSQYTMVKENMKAATKDWENTCNVKFFYDEQKDASNILTPTPDLTFVIMGYDNINNDFIASAFFVCH